jgi:hypothetical protein
MTTTEISRTQTLIHLRESIEHWNRLATGTTLVGETHYSASCALCGLFCQRLDDANACIGCPVMAKTGRRGCGGTPWHDVEESYQAGGFDSPESPEFRRAAAQMRDWLQQLLNDLLSFESASIPTQLTAS